MIQTEIPDGRGGIETLDHNDPRYWEGPYKYTPYPKALYRQTQPGQDCETLIVKNQHEHERNGSGWYESPADAKAAFQGLEADMAKAAAERIASDARMSEMARAEAIRADRATDVMLGEIPEQKRRGRPKKVVES